MYAETNYPELSNNDLHALFRETGRQFQESGRQFQESGRQFQESSRQFQESGKQLKETGKILRENGKQLEATKDRLEKLIQSQEKTEQLIKDLTEKQSESERLLQETELIFRERSAAIDRQIEKVSKQMERTDKMMGGISNNNGLFAEEYFFNSIKKDGKTLFGEKFDKLIKAEIIEDENNKTKGELDTLLINCTSAAIIEVKYRVREKSVAEVMKKVKPFRDKFPEYRNHRLYLGLASLVFDEAVEKDCRENGIAVIKQVGDKVVVYDENLKTF